MRRALLPGLAAAALLGAAGCEFWDNLSGDKPITRAALTVTVADALTGAPLQAACRDSAGGAGGTADAEGRLALQGLPTGPLALECTHHNYRPRRSRVDLGKAGADLRVEMAREGGESWYAEDGLRVTVDTADSKGGFRFPRSEFRLVATPADDQGRFSYRWSSNVERAAGSLPESSKSPSVRVVNGALPGEVVEETLTLVVMATLAGETYEAGQATLDLTLRRNHPPSFTFAVPPDTSVRSCRDNRFRAWIRPNDPDGNCLHVLYRSLQPLATLGRLETTFPCSSLVKGSLPMLRHSVSDSVRYDLKDSLLIRVMDDNEAYAETTLTFRTEPNIVPRAALELRSTGSLRSGTAAAFLLTLSDENHAVNPSWVHWGDGDSTGVDPGDLRHRYETTVEHAFSDPGRYEVRAVTVDDCGDTATAVLPVDVTRP